MNQSRGVCIAHRLSLLALLAACLSLLTTGVTTAAASEQTSTYVFVAEESTLVQTGGIAGVHRTYTVEGRFQLSVDPNTATASFVEVDANATDAGNPPLALDPNEVFNLTALTGTLTASGACIFDGRTRDGSSSRITLTFSDSLVHVSGETMPPPGSADFFIFSIDAVAQRKYGGGTGEPNDPYQIATAADLIALGETPEDYDKHFLLTADINLDPNLPGRRVFNNAVIAPDADPTDWGSELQGTSFSGVFDGNGHTILHLTVDGITNLGLFGELAPGAIVLNLGVEAVDVNGVYYNVGGLAGRNEGVIVDCYCTGKVDGDWSAGGLVGRNRGLITGAHNAAIVDGDTRVGGIAGFNLGGITACYNTGTVRGHNSAGGITGDNGGSVSMCQNLGLIDGFSRTGGIAGVNWSGSITTCYNAGPISGEDCIGGLVGQNWWYSSIATSYSMGAVAGASNVGGLIGWSYGSVASSFWDVETSGQKCMCGRVVAGDGCDDSFGKTTGAMQDIGTYLGAGWDFVGESGNGTSEMWQMPPEGGYPVLTVLSGYVPVQLEGAGTRDDPYLVSNKSELGAVVHYEPFAHYRLTNSIDLSGIRWRAAVIPYFSGTLDGNDLAISCLTVAGSGHLALFGRLGENAQVRNLSLEDVSITGTSAAIGALVAENAGRVVHCSSSGVVSGFSDVGGLLGRNSGTVARCCNDGVVRGVNTSGTATDVGGLVGHNAMNGVAIECFSTGEVSGGWAVGGLVGANSSNSGSPMVSNCYSTSSVTGESIVNGLVGVGGGTVTCSYGAGAVRGATDGGGLSGGGAIQGCFWDNQGSGRGGTTAQMQTAKTFLDAGWDFVGETANGTEDIWKIAEELDYPRLWWEPYDGRVTVVLGEIFTVTLESNPGTGYRWEWVDDQDSIVEQVGEAQFTPRETGDLPLVGAGGWESFDFMAVHPGQMILTLVYRRAWEEGVEPLKTFSLQVTVP
jgi:predicted secreted protein